MSENQPQIQFIPLKEAIWGLPKLALGIFITTFIRGVLKNCIYILINYL